MQTERALSEVQQHGDAVEMEQEQEVVEDRAPKRRRGRPRKNSDVNELDKDPAAGSASKIEVVPHEAPKKKRGRPKKQPAARSREQDEAEEEIIPPQINAPDIPVLEGEDRVAGPEAENSSQGTDAPRETKRRKQEAPETEENPDTLEPMKETVESEAVMTGRKGAKAASTTTTASTASSAPKASRNTKPAYRVGLSKRSKIAPLLKMVRKE